MVSPRSRASWRPRTLAARLAVTIGLFVLLATAAATVWAYTRERSAVLADARAALEARARLSADRIDRAIAERARLTALWPGLSTTQDLALDDVDKRVALSLEELADHVGGGALALATDTLDRVVAASTPEWIGRTLSMDGWSRDPGRPGEAVVAEIDGSEALLATWSPVFTSDGSSRLGRILLLSPWRALVTDAVGGEATPLELRLGGEPLFRGDLYAMPGGPGELLVARAMVGDNRIQPLEIGVAMPVDQAVAPLRGITRSLLLFAALVLAITLPGAVLLARSTTGELRRLTGRAREAERTGTVDFGAAPATAPAEVQVLTGALHSMVERLEASQRELARQESLAAMGTMAAGLAHEIRTPLSVIRTSAEMLVRRAAPDSREAELASFTVEEVDRLSRLVEDLLAFARPRAPDLGPTDLEAAAARASRSIALGSDAAEIRTELASAPVLGDAEQLYQVALNLVSNAVQASPPGGVVRLSTGVEGGQAVLRVIDAGPGIAPEDLAHVWDPFFSRRSGGTGLGLPIVRRIAEEHGGRVTLEPAPDGGTIATLRIPLRHPSNSA